MRLTAKRIPIDALKSGEFVATEGRWEPNYLMSEKYGKVSRVAVYGVVISKYSNMLKDFCSLTIDDLTGDVRVTGFKGMAKTLNNFNKGDVVLVVGRLKKDLKDNIYIFPEIVKKTTPEMFFLNVVENY
ncbi:MAG: hypothetical protein PWP15_1260 [Methanothermococcus sp.]|jgi:hypothetical protein|uniref:OB-fold nucleic acid binding domain-containing protein n=1 Tax=Methanothermococcus TaxID=155862 RepID=UPI00037DD46D|nr:MULTISPECIES: OB-fold nucleic acid binding domain-containing protein [Methanothermococcus]MDK2790753.1 hypothetical protein [Methanothermococcus sp.]MDK2987882.1 hypothetical protein [Methanothermococcus sp.]